MKTNSRLFASIIFVLAVVFCVSCLSGCELARDYLCEHRWGEWTVITDATCTTEGVRERTCTVCGAVAGGTLKLTDHTPAEDDGDCTTEVICTVCGGVAVEASTGHSGGMATCMNKANCDACGMPYGELAEHIGDTVWMKHLDSHYPVYSCCFAQAGDAEAHTKINGVCTVCGFNPSITATAVEITQGQRQVEIVLSITDNPGVVGLSATMQYSADALKLVYARSGAALGNLAFTAPNNLNSGCTFLWDGVEIKDEHIKDGEILILTFEVAENIPVGEYIIQLSVKAYDNDLNPVPVTVSGGKITVKNS